MEQGTLSLKMRDFTPDDYDRLVEVYNANYPDYPWSVKEWRARDEAIDKTKFTLQRYTFTQNGTDRAVAFGEYNHNPENYHLHKYWIRLLVDPAAQGNGIGAYVYNFLVDKLKNRNAILVSTMVIENLPRLVGFMEKRGFKEAFRVWESRLDVAKADTKKLQAYEEKARKEGITFTSLMEARENSTTFLRNLHELVQLITADMPTSQPFTPLSYEQWERFEMENPTLLPDAYMIAKDGDKLAGLSVGWKIEAEPKTLAQGNTGVRREYRGKGIAVALKLRLIDYAKKHGYEKMKTWNGTNNVEMLGINTKLGFKREVAWLTMEKNLA